MTDQQQNYAGFWIRVGATLIDTALLLLLSAPFMLAIYGKSYWRTDSLALGYWDVLLNYVLPAVVVVAFWIVKSATPGKILLGLRIADAQTGEQPSTAKFLLRYVGYFIAGIPLGLGLLWVAFDKRKQGWHDKIAGTLVLKNDA